MHKGGAAEEAREEEAKLEADVMEEGEDMGGEEGRMLGDGGRMDGEGGRGEGDGGRREGVEERGDGEEGRMEGEEERREGEEGRREEGEWCGAEGAGGARRGGVELRAAWGGRGARDLSEKRLCRRDSLPLSCSGDREMAADR
ncbi:unnamed protein product [Closterium sp. Yama58-4]|nr:unnamed protein product [Closterium sp. Yama58-4]